MRVIPPNIFKSATVEVPSSKSISNRLLIIQALAQHGQIVGLSDAKDSVVLKDALDKLPSELNVGHAGTAFRFLTAFLSIQIGEFILTGSNRMKKRPIKILVDALTSLGAEISYLEEEGFPPLKIRGGKLNGNRVTVDGGVSSQYITALMLIAPCLPEGLKIELSGNLVSKPYLEMTAKLMKECGVPVDFRQNEIIIPQGNYHFDSITVEKDWSAIAFWYELVCLGGAQNVVIRNVRDQSIQGDRRVIELFDGLGVKSEFTTEGLQLSYSNHNQSKLELVNFISIPDLVQPFISTLVGLKKPLEISGTTTLKNKETDRGEALKQELFQFGGDLKIGDNSIKVQVCETQKSFVSIQTYEDHRMAMSLAPLALKFGELEILNPEVVEKSYPNFWKELEKVGFEIEN